MVNRRIDTHKQNLKDQGFPHREGETDKKKEPGFENSNIIKASSSDS
jgi:hypothetical protein